MNNAQPLFNSATHYRIEVRGQDDVDWLQSFDGSAEISAEETLADGGYHRAQRCTPIKRRSSGWCAGSTDWE